MDWSSWIKLHFPRPGARIGLWAAHSEQYHTALFALISEGRTPVPLNTRFTLDELESAARIIDLSGILIDDSFPYQNTSFDPEIPLLPWPAIHAENPSVVHLHTGAASGVILFTSGTSGSVKAVSLSVSSLQAHARAVNQHLRVTARDRWLCCLPLFHIGGLAILFRSHELRQLVQFASPGSTEEITAMLDSGTVTMASVVPTMLRSLLSARGDRPFHPILRALIVGGGRVDDELLKRCPIALPTYGATETGSMLTCARPCSVRAERMSAGLPIPGTSILIVDDNGNHLPPEQEGEIHASGYGLFSEYVNDRHSTAAALKDGFFATGDIGCFDSLGCLHVSGRKDMQIKSGGEKIHPQELEQVLRMLPGVDDAVVLPVADEVWGDVPGAVVQTASPHWTTEALAAAVSDQVARYKKLRYIATVDRLPLLANGKPDFERLKKLLHKAKRV